MSEIGDEYYAVFTDCLVATDGTAEGNGTLASPISWAKAKLLYDTLWPGVSLKFRAGTYAMDDGVNFSGNPQGDLTLVAQAGEVVKINGSIWMERDHAVLRDMEIYDADFTTRNTVSTGSNPPDIPQRDGARAENEHVKIIGLIIHDTRQGFISSPTITSLDISDCIIFYNGWNAPDRGHGHGIYCGTVHVKNCIIFDNFGYGLHGYMGGPNIIYENCICFGSGEINSLPQCNILIGGLALATNFLVKNCQTYFRDLSSGFEQFIAFGNGCIIQDCLFAAYKTRIDVTGTDIQITGNKFYGDLMNFTAEAYPSNTYSATRPNSGTDVFVHPSDNYVGRAYVAIYNWAGANTVSVDMTAVAGLSVDDSVTVANVQDLFVDIQTLTLDADKKIVVNMQAVNRSMATPQGWSAPATTFPQFGAFVVEKA